MCRPASRRPPSSGATLPAMPWRLALLLFVLFVGPAGARAAELGPGARAPEIVLTGSDGREYRLSDLVGKRGVVLAWFPKAFTAG